MRQKRLRGGPTDMETSVTSDPRCGTAARFFARDTSPAFGAADQPLLELGQCLKEAGYRFTTVTSASHALVVSRASKGHPSLTDIFGWSRPFLHRTCHRTCPPGWPMPAYWISPDQPFEAMCAFPPWAIRFVHSSFPTEQADAVFFGPDTYRFARLFGHSLGSVKRPRGELKI